MAQFEKETYMDKDVFNVGIQDPNQVVIGRDEFGLPIIGNFKTGGNVAASTKDVGVSGVKNSQGQEKQAEGINTSNCEEPVKKSWANVLKSDNGMPQPKFSYFPMAEGSTVVQTPLEVLKKGNEKFKLCAVGTFTKGHRSFSAVSSFVEKFWRQKGLTNVYQKDECTYLFKFNSENSLNAFLSRGTWYISQKPMVVTEWGAKPGVNKITSMPLWIKLSNVPECY